MSAEPTPVNKIPIKTKLVAKASKRLEKELLKQHDEETKINKKDQVKSSQD